MLNCTLQTECSIEITSAKPQSNVSGFSPKNSQLFFPFPVSPKLQLLDSGFSVYVRF